MYEDAHRWGYLFQSYVLLTMMELHHKEAVSVVYRSCISHDNYGLEFSSCDAREKCVQCKILFCRKLTQEVRSLH